MPTRTASTPTAGPATTRARRATSTEHGASRSISRRAAAGRPGCAPGTDRRSPEPDPRIYHLIGGTMSCTSRLPVAVSSRWPIAVAVCTLAAASALSAPPKPDPDDAGRLYVEVGSPANALGDPDRALHAKGKDPTEFLKTHGGFWRFDPAKPSQKEADGFHYSTGHRHIMAIAWNPVSKTFFTVM